MMPKCGLLALDIDGTLVTNDGRLTEPTKEWVNRAVEAGTTVMLATGRAMRTTEGIRHELGLTGPMVLLNGAEIWKEPGVLLQRHYLAEDKRHQLRQLAVDHDAWYWITAVGATFSKKQWAEEASETDWLKFGIRHDDPHVLRHLRDIIEGWGLYTVTSSHPSNIEVGPKGLSKATGLMTVCSELGIALQDVMAIGDGRNDMHMIESVGLGIAMGNGHPDLKRVADAVTSTNEEDGVARAIAQHLLADAS
jgi:HAD superfamily hydrolase (TIGR01484 family)